MCEKYVSIDSKNPEETSLADYYVFKRINNSNQLCYFVGLQ